MICQRCQQEKPQVEFNTWIRYQRPISEPYSQFCVSCYWEQMTHQTNWNSCLVNVLWRSQFADDGSQQAEKEMKLFAPLSVDDLIRPLLQWAYGVTNF